jgi:hypothetical protein
MQAYIKKHGPNFPNHRIKVDWTQNDRHLNIQFEVQKRVGKDFLSNEAFTNEWSKNWGLWNHDVVEAFLQLRIHKDDIHAPYLEIQVSPLNQPFALIITEPRKKFFAPPKLEFQTESLVDGKIWRSRMEVVLPEEIKGTHLYGGFFACLEQNPREFYALELNPEETPDFHRPELFQPLSE